jgi:hypothetical protein
MNNGAVSPIAGSSFNVDGQSSNSKNDGKPIRKALFNVDEAAKENAAAHRLLKKKSKTYVEVETHKGIDGNHGSLMMRPGNEGIKEPQSAALIMNRNEYRQIKSVDFLGPNDVHPSVLLTPPREPLAKQPAHIAQEIMIDLNNDKEQVNSLIDKLYMEVNEDDYKGFFKGSDCLQGTYS